MQPVEDQPQPAPSREPAPPRGPVTPATLSEFIDAVRAGLVCDRCGRYVGSLAQKKYLPPAYPVALDKIPADDEAAALVGFEWYMLNRMREGNFVIRHPQGRGGCVSLREWAEQEEDDGLPGDSSSDESESRADETR